ncbi:hypothetical protein JXB02_01195 [Candidatus Woesearchaeota archaeon]|nr:hypothetical protein [Candidatus Woesearchaeota archaeon]
MGDVAPEVQVEFERDFSHPHPIYLSEQLLDLVACRMRGTLGTSLSLPDLASPEGDGTYRIEVPLLADFYERRAAGSDGVIDDELILDTGDRLNMPVYKATFGTHEFGGRTYRQLVFMINREATGDVPTQKLEGGAFIYNPAGFDAQDPGHFAYLTMNEVLRDEKDSRMGSFFFEYMASGKNLAVHNVRLFPNMNRWRSMDLITRFIRMAEVSGYEQMPSFQWVEDHCETARRTNGLGELATNPDLIEDQSEIIERILALPEMASQRRIIEQEFEEMSSLFVDAGIAERMLQNHNDALAGRALIKPNGRLDRRGDAMKELDMELFRKVLMEQYRGEAIKGEYGTRPYPFFSKLYYQDPLASERPNIYDVLQVYSHAKSRISGSPVFSFYLNVQNLAEGKERNRWPLSAEEIELPGGDRVFDIMHGYRGRRLEVNHWLARGDRDTIERFGEDLRMLLISNRYRTAPTGGGIWDLYRKNLPEAA